MSNDTPAEKRWYGGGSEQQAAPANSASEWINLPGGGSQLRTYRQGGLVWEHAPPRPSDQASRWYGNSKKP